MATSTFTDLKVWQSGHAMVLAVYKIVKTFPKDEQFGLVSQMKRSSASVTANIAEGYGRQHSKEKEQFYLISAGSLFELKDQLLIARDVGYIEENEFLAVAELVNKCHAQLNALLAAHRSSRNSKFEIPNSSKNETNL